MNMMNLDLAYKQLALDRGRSRRSVRSRQSVRLIPPKPVHRPSVALILLATTAQIIAMATLLGAVVTVVQ